MAFILFWPQYFVLPCKKKKKTFLMFLPFLLENIQNSRDSLWHVMGPPEGRVNVPSCHWSHRSNNKPMPFLMDTTKLKGRQWICQIRLHHCEGGLWVSWGLKGLNGLQCLLNFKKNTCVASLSVLIEKFSGKFVSSQSVVEIPWADGSRR